MRDHACILGKCNIIFDTLILRLLKHLLYGPSFILFAFVNFF